MSRRAPDVVDILTDQHRQIRRTFRKAAMPGAGRAAAFERLVRLLAVHEAAEQAHVHPVMRRVAPYGKAWTAARRDEEKRAKTLLAALRAIGPRGAGYLGVLWQLRREVLAHAAREEQQEFPVLRRALSVPRRRLLGLEVRAAQVIAPTRPHRLVNNEAANRLAAPLLGPLDRALDFAAHRSGRR